MPKNEKNMKFDDPIDEIHRFRDEQAKKFNYDIDAIIADLKRREKDAGVKSVILPVKRLPKMTGS